MQHTCNYRYLSPAQHPALFHQPPLQAGRQVGRPARPTMNFTDRAIDCTPGKIITLTLTCGSGSQVQTALRCDSDSSGNGNIHLFESHPCGGGVVQGYGILEVLLVFCVLAMAAVAAYPVFCELMRWRKTVARREEELVEEEMKEAEAARKWAGLTLERVPSHSDGEESDSESDFGCNTGSGESESSWTPSRCGIELKRSTISED